MLTIAPLDQEVETAIVVFSMAVVDNEVATGDPVAYLVEVGRNSAVRYVEDADMVVAVDPPPSDEVGCTGSLRRNLDSSVLLCDVVATSDET